MFRIKPPILLFIVGFITYANSLFNSFVLEDRANILRNPSIQNFFNIPNLFFHQVGGQESLGYYRPILFTFYTFIYSIFGEFTFPYHFVQLLLQIGNSILFFILFKKYINKQIALVISILFLIHPINEETVVWIANLQDVLFVFFGLLSLHLLQRKILSTKNIILSNLLVLLSLFSKETGVLFVFLGFLYVYLYHKKDFWFYSFFTGIVGVTYAILRLASQIPFQKESLVPIMNLSLIERMIQMPNIIFYYLKTLVFPYNLVVYHSEVIREKTFVNFYLPLFSDIAFFSLLSFFIYKLIKKGHDKKIVLFFTVWFLLGLLMHIQIIPLDFTVADHFFLFPLIGLLGLLGLFINQFDKKILNHKMLTYLMFVVLILFFIRTVIRNFDWRDQKTLLSHDVKVSQNDYLLELVYTTELINENKLDEAFMHANKAISLYPESYLGWSSLGAIYYQKGIYYKAREAFEKSLTFGKNFGTYENLGLLLLKHGSLSEANKFLRNATVTFPNSKKLWYYRLISEYKSGNHDDALHASKNYYLLQQDQQSYAIYSYLLEKKPIKIEF